MLPPQKKSNLFFFLVLEIDKEMVFLRQTITESLSYQNQKLLFPAEIKEVLSYLWGVVKLGAFCHTLKEKRDSNPDAILQRFGCAMKTS